MQARIISAELFAQNGVGGTSLRMIADAIGVTKAAVYHQHNTKGEVVLAAAQAELERVDACSCRRGRANASGGLVRHSSTASRLVPGALRRALATPYPDHV